MNKDTDKEKEVKKKKRKREESEIDDEDKKRKRHKKISSRIDSKIQSVDDNDNDKEDPLKDKNRLKLTKRIISHLCLLVFIFAFQSMVLGIVAQQFYSNKQHLFMYGIFAVIQLIGAPIGFWAIQVGNRVLLLLCVVFNCIWIILVIILILYYWVLANNDAFDQEIALHVSAIFSLSASLTLAITCFIMMKQIEMINFSAQPTKSKDSRVRNKDKEMAHTK